MASYLHPRHRTSASWRRLDNQYLLKRPLRVLAIGLALALLVWTCWLAWRDAGLPG